jgi:hypothetical protein
MLELELLLLLLHYHPYKFLKKNGNKTLKHKKHVKMCIKTEDTQTWEECGHKKGINMGQKCSLEV